MPVNKQFPKINLNNNNNIDLDNLDPNNNNTISPDDDLPRFFTAIKNKDTDTFNKLINSVPSLINRQDANGHCAIIVAIQFNPDWVTDLIKAGAKVNVATLYGHTPLHFAVAQGVGVGLIEELLYAGADPNLETFYNTTSYARVHIETPLDSAIKKKTADY